MADRASQQLNSAPLIAALMERYSGPLTPQDMRSPPLEPLGLPRLPPLPPRAEVRNLGPRPADAMAPVAESLSPTMGAYGFGGLATQAALDARQGTYNPDTLLPLAMSIFAGPKAKIANVAALERAEAMAARGSGRDAIWNETGWFQGAKDGKWRFEIDDSGMRLKPSADWRPANEHFRHPELEAAYPGAMERIDSMVRLSPSSPAKGLVEQNGPETMMLVSAPTKADARGIGVHELQHALPQAMEGFEPGATPAYVAGSPAYRELLARLSARQPITPQLKETLANHLYHRMAGEAEARNVERRIDMAPAERRATPPWQTEDIPADQQVTFADLLRAQR